MLEFRILGPLEVLDDGAPVQLGGRNQRALLTLLLLRANEAVSTERLIDQLWGEHPPRTATTSLQNAVAQLRKLLGAELQLHTRPRATCSRSTQSQLDLARFERLVSEARTAEPAASRRAPARGARALARPGARRLGARGVRADGDPPARGPSPRRARGADRRPTSSGVDAELVAELEALVRRHPAARATARPADARALPVRPAGGCAQAYHDARRDARRRARHRSRAGAAGPLRLDPPAGALARARCAAGARGPLRRGAAGVLGRPARARPRPGAGGVAGDELATLLAERFELAGDASRPRLRLAGAWRPGTGSGRCTTSCTSRSTATSSRPRCTRGSPRCRRCFARAGCRSS